LAPNPNRLSTLFDVWRGGSRAAPSRNSIAENRKSVVSEPKLVPHFTGGGFTSMDTIGEPVDEVAFEAMLVCPLVRIIDSFSPCIGRDRFERSRPH
jgi:hypothetical protein